MLRIPDETAEFRGPAQRNTKLARERRDRDTDDADNDERTSGIRKTLRAGGRIIMLGDGTEVVNSSDNVVDDSDEPFEKSEDDSEALSKPAAKTIKSEHDDEEMKDATAAPTLNAPASTAASNDSKPSTDPPTKQEDKEV